MAELIELVELLQLDLELQRRATVAAGVSVTRSVVWPDSAVDADAEGAIVTPRQRIRVGDTSPDRAPRPS